MFPSGRFPSKLHSRHFVALAVAEWRTEVNPNIHLEDPDSDIWEFSSVFLPSYPSVKYNETLLIGVLSPAQKIMIFSSIISRTSLELILCEFQVHMSTPTSPTESFKLTVEMDLWSLLCFDTFWNLFGVFIWRDVLPIYCTLCIAKTLRILKHRSQDLQDECSDWLRSFTQPRRVPRSVCCAILKGNGRWETLLIRYYFIVDVGMEMSRNLGFHYTP